jgi:predicted permease
MLTRLWNKLRFALRGGRSFESELDEELDFHRRMLEADRIRRGESPLEAELGAARRMGNVALAREDAREAWLWRWLDTLARDVRYAFRTLLRNPGFATATALTLALGIGANAAIFRLVDLVMLRMLPVQRPEELLVLRSSMPYPHFEQLRDRNEVFSDVFGAHTLRDAAFSVDSRSLGSGSLELVSGSYFRMLGVKAASGRTLLPEDDRAPESSPVAVLSHGFWTRAFGGSPDAIGKTLRVRGGSLGGSGTSGFETASAAKRREETLLTIVGVAAPEFFGDSVGSRVDVWTPMMMQPALMPGRAWLTRTSASWVQVMGRRKPGVSEAQAKPPLTALVRQIRLDELGPKASDEDRANIAKLTLTLESGEKGFGQIRRSFSQPLLVLQSVVVLVLLIACLNVANLLLARATARRHEIAMRLALGASRLRVVRQLLTESLVLSGIGAALGLAVAAGLTRALLTMVADAGRPATLEFQLDWRTLAFTGGVALACGVVFGLAPALRGTRGMEQSLKDGARTTSGGGRAAKALVSLQVAASLVLLVGAGLFVRTLMNLKAQPVGYDPRGLVLARVDPVGAGYKGDEIGRKCVELMKRLAALPGVERVTFSENGLFSGTESASLIEIPGFPHKARDDQRARFDQVGPGYFTNVGIPLLLGRDIEERDAAGAPRVAVINETMARFYFGGASPIGRQIKYDDQVSLEIVGVASDARDHGFRDEAMRRRFYVSYQQPVDGITTANFEIRAANPDAVFGPVREEIRRFDAGLQVQSLRSLHALMDQSVAVERLVARLSGMFGALAALLAGIGLYGVMSYAVARRTSEIGIRMALGARGAAIARMILREVTLLLGSGSLLGLLAAGGLAGFVESLIFGLAPIDPLTYLACFALLLGVGLLAGYLPARRAARIDPLRALRYE